MSEQRANVESYIARLRKPCGVPPFVQREIADILEALLAKAKEAATLAGEEAIRRGYAERAEQAESRLAVCIDALKRIRGHDPGAVDSIIAMPPSALAMHVLRIVEPDPSESKPCVSFATRFETEAEAWAAGAETGASFRPAYRSGGWWEVELFDAEYAPIGVLSSSDTGVNK